MATPVGPLFAIGDQVITKSGYWISYQELQRTGQAPVFYWSM
jgi:hypothetical protein